MLLILIKSVTLLEIVQPFARADFFCCGFFSVCMFVMHRTSPPIHMEKVVVWSGIWPCGLSIQIPVLLSLSQATSSSTIHSADNPGPSFMMIPHEIIQSFDLILLRQVVQWDVSPSIVIKVVVFFVRGNQVILCHVNSKSVFSVRSVVLTSNYSHVFTPPPPPPTLALKVLGMTDLNFVIWLCAELHL